MASGAVKSNTKLSRSALQRIRRSTALIDSVGALARALNPKDVEELIRRDQIPYDGRISSGDPSTAGRRGSGTPHSPVERAVVAHESAEIARAKGKPDPHRDVVAEATKEIETSLIEIERLLQTIFRRIDYVNNPVDKKRTQKSSDPCEVCHVLPIVRLKMCVDCEIEWTQAGCPDRDRWFMYMNQTRTSEGRVLVSDPPPPRAPLVRADS